MYDSMYITTHVLQHVYFVFVSGSQERNAATLIGTGAELDQRGRTGTTWISSGLDT
jgi:hypothetical protein